MTASLDVPAPAAGLIIAVIAIAVAFLMCVDWTHPNAHNRPEQ